MPPLAQILALLPMAMATVIKEVVSLDVARDSFDDQYQGCHPAITATLPALNCSEFYQNCVFAQIWVKAVAKWQMWGPAVTPLSPGQATTIMA
ncbi:hypothetical protein EK904_013378 [Melospiza melodia maxima]|nr:hypothetical protein EK904_013378 [Melospiza melodia maxima]